MDLILNSLVTVFGPRQKERFIHYVSIMKEQKDRNTEIDLYYMNQACHKYQWLKSCCLVCRNRLGPLIKCKFDESTAPKILLGLFYLQFIKFCFSLFQSHQITIDCMNLGGIFFTRLTPALKQVLELCPVTQISSYEGSKCRIIDCFRSMVSQSSNTEHFQSKTSLH